AYSYVFGRCVLVLYLFVCLLFYFFFQAEDGIRDDLVTGVQTCALPISRCAPAWPGARPRWCAPGSRSSVLSAPGTHGLPRPRLRSEERRVGKECRSRWATSS